MHADRRQRAAGAHPGDERRPRRPAGGAGGHPAPPDPDQPGITCTFTNTSRPKATLTLVKEVRSGTAAPSLWTLTRHRDRRSEISGRRARAAVTDATGAGRDVRPHRDRHGRGGDRIRAGGRLGVPRPPPAPTVPVTAGSVTLADSAVDRHRRPGDLHRSRTGWRPDRCRSARWSTPRPAPTRAATPRRSPGPTTAAPGSPAPSHADHGDAGHDHGHPRRRTCTVTETPPTGGLANASYAWGAADVQRAAGDDRRRGHGGGHDHQPRRPALRDVRHHQDGRRAGRVHRRHRPGVPGRLHVHAHRRARRRRARST